MKFLKLTQQKRVRTTATYVDEEDNAVELTAEGQDEDFHSEDEIEDEESRSVHRGQLLSLERNSKQLNNNAVVATSSAVKSPELNHLEKVGEGIEDSINKSLTNFQNYFEKRIADLERTVGVKATHNSNGGGQPGTIEGKDNASHNFVEIDQDQRSKATVYRPAVQKHRGSSSSEEGMFNDSDEQDRSNSTSNDEPMEILPPVHISAPPKEKQGGGDREF